MFCPHSAGECVSSAEYERCDAQTGDFDLLFILSVVGELEIVLVIRGVYLEVVSAADALEVEGAARIVVDDDDNYAAVRREEGRAVGLVEDNKAHLLLYLPRDAVVDILFVGYDLAADRNKLREMRKRIVSLGGVIFVALMVGDDESVGVVAPFADCDPRGPRRGV